MAVTGESVGEAVKELRARLSETQERFAKRLGVAVATLARYEIGAQQPRESILHQLATIAETEGFIHVARRIRTALDNKLEEKNKFRALKAEGMVARVSALRRTIEKSAKETSEIVTRFRVLIDQNPHDPDLLRVARDVQQMFAAHEKTIETLNEIVTRFRDEGRERSRISRAPNRETPSSDSSRKER